MESNNGGDLLQLGNDLAVVMGDENQFYLAMFGGNVESNTPTIDTGNERTDYWANEVFWLEDQNKQFNSFTERVLNNTPLTSSGRILIENAVKNDLKYLSSEAAVTVNVTIPANDTVKIAIQAIYNTGKKTVAVYQYKKTLEGDFSLIDFNNDFY